MAQTFRPRIQAKTVQNMARRMIKFKGREMSQTAFHKFLQQDKDLHHIVYRSGTMSKHEAQQFIKSLAKKVGGHEQMDFSHFAKKHNLASTSPSGELSDIAVRHAYDMSAQEENARDAPKGPTKAELEKMKIAEQKKKLRNLTNRKLAELMEKKQGNISSIASFKRDPKEPHAQVSAAEPNRAHPEGDTDQKRKPGVSLPALEHTTAFTQFAESDDDAEPFVVNPQKDQKLSEVPLQQEPKDDEKPTPPESPIEPKEESDPVNVDEELPL